MKPHDSPNKRELMNAYSKGYVAGLRRGRTELQSAIRKQIAALTSEISELKKPTAVVHEPRAHLAIVLPGRPDMVDLLWPRDCNRDDLEMIEDLVSSAMQRWMLARPVETYSKVRD